MGNQVGNNSNLNIEIQSILILAQPKEYFLDPLLEEISALCCLADDSWQLHKLLNLVWIQVQGMGFHCLVSTHFLKEQYVYYANRRVLQIKFQIGMYLQGMRPNKVFLLNKVTYILNASLCSLYKFVRTSSRFTSFDRFLLGLLNAYTIMANPIDIIHIIFLGAPAGLVVTMSNLIFHPSNFMIQHVLYSIMYTLEPWWLINGY